LSFIVGLFSDVSSAFSQAFSTVRELLLKHRQFYWPRPKRPEL